MKATDFLMSEHRVIERVIGAIEIAAEALERGMTVRPGFFLRAAEFIENFTDRGIHFKVEDALFTAMIQNGLSAKSGPVIVMLHEHEQGRVFTREMRAAAQAVVEGHQGASSRIIQNAMGYATLLRQHIRKEDRILYPMAENLLPAEQQAQIMEVIDLVERTENGEEEHEKYLALAEVLVKEAANLSEEA